MVQYTPAWVESIALKMKTIAIRNAIILGITIFFILFIAHFPTWYASINTPIGYVYTGDNAWFDPWDINVYVTAIRWGQEGHFLLKNLYTTQNLPPALMYPLYTGVGFMMRGLDPYLLFTLIAGVIGIFICISMYMLSRYFFPNSFLKRIALLLLTSLGGGLSWIINWDPSPDGWVTSFTYHSLFQRGHEGLGVLSYVAFLVLLFVSLTKGASRKRIALLIVSYVIALLSYPYMYVHAVIVSIGVYMVFSTVRNRNYFAVTIPLILLGAVEIGLYYSHLQQSGFASVATQQLTGINPLRLVLGYGLFFVTFVYAFLFLTKNLWVRFFLMWIIVGWLLSFIPIGVARFFLRGLYFPMAALAVYTIEDVSVRYRVKKQAIYILYTAFALLTAITIFHMRIKSIDAVNVWTYMRKEDSDALSFLQTKKNVHIVASYYISNHIPAKTGASVYFGHAIQTPQAQQKSDITEAFYLGKWKQQKARRFLLGNHITYVYYGTVEKELFKAPLYPFLKPVYKKGGVTIYRVT